jgi:hypothetical protein
MVITFVGNFEVSYSSENHHANSLESLGHTVKKLQEGKVSTEQILKNAIESDLLIYVHTHGWVNLGDLSLDLVLQILNKTGIPTLTYHLDLWFGLDREKDLHQDPFYKNIGYFFATDKLMTDWFNENTEVKGVYLPAGVYDKECYISQEYDQAANEIIFVGSKGYHPEWEYRPKLIDWLRQTYTSRFTHVGGDGDTGTIRGERLNNVYATSKIAVGDTLCIGYDYPYYFSDRLFESTGRGAFTIFPYIKGIEDCFEIGKEIITYEFNNFDDLQNKIDYYLTHDDKREKIRRAGHERTKRNHTYLNRWRTILEKIKHDKK